MALNAITLRAVATRCFDGHGAEPIALELGLSSEEVRFLIECVEAVLLLLARSMPPTLIPRAARLDPGDAEAILQIIREELVSADRILSVVEKRRLETPSASVKEPDRSARSVDIPLSEAREEALGVLDFWTSRWE